MKYHWAFMLTITLLCTSTLNASTDWSQSMIKIFVSTRGYDYYRPWKKVHVGNAHSQGIAVSKSTILTLASNVRNASYIQIKIKGHPAQIPAKLELYDEQCNLALLKVDPKSLPRKLKPIRFSEKFVTGSDIRGVYSSSTLRFISEYGKLENFNTYKDHFGRAYILRYTYSGMKVSFGTLILSGKNYIGLADEGNTIIPGFVINRFLHTDRKNPRSVFPLPGFSSIDLEEGPLRKSLGLKNKQTHGIYITKVHGVGSGRKVFKKGDVLLELDGIKVGAQSRVSVHPYTSIHYTYLFNTFEIDQKVEAKVMRDGKEMQLEFLAENYLEKDTRIPIHHGLERPPYHIVGGFVFMKLSRKYLEAWGKRWTKKAPQQLYRAFLKESLMSSKEEGDFVYLSQVLPSDSNIGYQNLHSVTIESFNGKKLKSLSDIPALLEAGKGQKYHVIELEGRHPTLLIPVQDLDAIDREIAHKYRIEKLFHTAAP